MESVIQHLFPYLRGQESEVKGWRSRLGHEKMLKQAVGQLNQNCGDKIKEAIHTEPLCKAQQ